MLAFVAPAAPALDAGVPELEVLDELPVETNSPVVLVRAPLPTAPVLMNDVKTARPSAGWSSGITV